MSNYGFSDFIPGISWSTVDRTWSLRERDPETGASSPIPLEPPIRFMVDIGTARWGSVAFAPRFDLRTVPINEDRPEIPDLKDDEGKPAFKNVVEVKLYGPQINGLRLLLACGAFFTRTILMLIGEAEDFAEAQAGQIPIVEWVGDSPRKVSRGPGAGRVYYVPDLRIRQWVDRIPALGARTVPVPVPLPALPAPAMQMSPDPADLVALPATKARGGSKSSRIIDDALPFAMCRE